VEVLGGATRFEEKGLFFFWQVGQWSRILTVSAVIHGTRAKMIKSPHPTKMGM